MRAIFREPTARVGAIFALGLAVLHWSMAVFAVQTKSPTFDEPTHLTAGCSYWLRQDHRLDPENGVLTQLWATLPVLAQRPVFPAVDSSAWRFAAQGKVATEFFYELGNDSDRMLLHARMMSALLSAALCLAIYFSSAAFFGRLGGLIACAATAFCPTVLANGALVTADVALSLFFLLAVVTIWRVLDRLTFVNLLAASASLAGVILAKMSGVLILPMIGAMLAIRLARGGELQVELFRTSRASGRWRLAAISSGALVVMALLAITAVWAAYGFRFAAVPAEDAYRTILEGRWDNLIAGGTFADRVISFARARHLLPEAYLLGFAYVHVNSAFRPAYLDGAWSVIGFHDFFLRSFFYKTPLSLFALLGLSVAAVVRWQSRHRILGAQLLAALYRTTPLWILFLVYGGSALAAHLNVGHRHLLPIYPALFVSCGACALLLREPGRLPIRLLPAVVLLWHAGASLAIAPDYLSYFNEAAGGSRAGFKHLVDSSLDWGQDLPALKQWLDEHPTTRPVYLAYFGTARPAHYGIKATSLGVADVPDLAPLTGGLYCVSATVLEQIYVRPMGIWARPYEEIYQALRPEFERTPPPVSTAGLDAKKFERARFYSELRFARLCAALRHRAPQGAPGYSILVFDLSDDEVARALSGPPPELAERPQVTGIEQ